MASGRAQLVRIRAEAPSIVDLIAPFTLTCQARGLSPRTTQSYGEGVAQLADFLSREGLPLAVDEVRREHIESFLVDLGSKWKPATVMNRFKSCTAFFKWAAEDEEISQSPMARMRPPKVEVDPPPLIPEDHLRRLLRACEGSVFDERRDMAIVRLFLDTGLRLSELAHLRLDDVALTEGIAWVVGKGARPRSVPFGVKSARAIDRYVRLRDRTEAGALSSALWIGARGPMTPSGIVQCVHRRCRVAAIPAFNVHKFRHTFAHEWLASGGSEGDHADHRMEVTSHA